MTNTERQLHSPLQFFALGREEHLCFIARYSLLCCFFLPPQWGSPGAHPPLFSMAQVLVAFRTALSLAFLAGWESILLQQMLKMPHTCTLISLASMMWAGEPILVKGTGGDVS